VYPDIKAILPLPPPNGVGVGVQVIVEVRVGVGVKVTVGVSVEVIVGEVIIMDSDVGTEREKLQLASKAVDTNAIMKLDDLIILIISPCFEETALQIIHALLYSDPMIIPVVV
jgi:hypothetical protein